MANFLEQLQQSLQQLDNRVKRLEQHLARLEKSTKQEESVHEEFVEQEIIVAQEKPSVLNWRKFELNIGTYVLQIVGVALFLLGAGFFLQYSAEKVFLTTLVRFVFVLFAATGFLVLGELLKYSYKQWSLGCVAGSILLYYLAFYAAFSAYGLFSLKQVFISFIFTTVLAGLLALWHDSYFIAFCSLVGGYCTPLLLKIQVHNPHLLSGYVIVLAVCYLIFSYAKKWFSLVYISLFFVIAYYTYPLAGLLAWQEEVSFLIATWFTFSFIPYFCMYAYPIKKREFESIVISVSTFFVMIGFFYTLSASFAQGSLFWQQAASFVHINRETIIAFIAIISSVLSIGMFVGLYLNRPKNTVLMHTLYALTVVNSLVTLFTLYIGYSFVIATSFFSVALLFISFYLKSFYMRKYVYGIWLVIGWFLIKLFFSSKYAQHGLINTINASLLALLSIVSIAYWLVYYYQAQLRTKEQHVSTILEGVLALLPLYFIKTGAVVFPYNVIILSWYALLLFFIGLYTQRVIIRQCSYGVAFLGVSIFSYWYFFKNLLNPYWTLSLHALYFSWIVVFIVALYSMHLWRHKVNIQNLAWVKKVVVLLLSLTVFMWIRSAIIVYCDVLHMHGAMFTKRLMGYSVQNDYLVRQPLTNFLLSIFYGCYAAILLFIGLLRQSKELRFFGLLLTVAALAKLSFVVVGISTALSKIIAFMIVGIAFIGISFLYQKMSKDANKN